MDLEDLLEDLLEQAGRAARRGARRVVTGTRPARRKVRRTVRATTAVMAVTLLLAALGLLAIGDPGAIRLVLGALALIGGAVSAGAAGLAQLADRRDPDVVRERAMARGELTPHMLDEDLSELPRDVRGDFRRLLQARQLVGDLAADGWVHPPSMLEVDGEVARLHRLLVVDRRARSLGGRQSAVLRGQVAELADLLVALADEAVDHQADAMVQASTTAVTLADARDHLQALREARAEVQQVDQRQRGTTAEG